MQLSPEDKQALLRAIILDTASIAVGVALFVLTGSWVWLLVGALMGVGFLMPPLIRISRSRTSD